MRAWSPRKKHKQEQPIILGRDNIRNSKKANKRNFTFDNNEKYVFANTFFLSSPARKTY